MDGPDGSGKSIMAGELAGILRSRGRPVVHLSIDDFHHVRAVRYRRGRDSPEGFWRDSYDYDRFRARVLAPFSPGGSRLYRHACHDLGTDEILDPPPQRAPAGALLLVDGLFLHRDELAGAWDLSLFLDVPFTETARRMAARDGTEPDPEHPGMRRYVQAQRIYYATCDPHSRATFVVDNRDVHAPLLKNRQ
ncbi:uridine kinase [Actinoplanes couchii]|uniref:Uridine kinase n=1 Tax=Actinoplanes couchii TaxID=403638 RepID=A0ABQ3XRF6_9ACTN|nr:uridine kinase [Actinoplanes couchii]MDR6321497.1 uridine kinase [Actinoplanes couchii]GID61096.1 uridine kinase [Actinoplanes couchii]